MTTLHSNMKHPKSEATLKRHNYRFDIFVKNEKGIVVNKIKKYRNDVGWPCIYRVEIDDQDTGERIQYYKGKLLQIMQTV